MANAVSASRPASPCTPAIKGRAYTRCNYADFARRMTISMCILMVVHWATKPSGSLSLDEFERHERAAVLRGNREQSSQGMISHTNGVRLGFWLKEGLPDEFTPKIVWLMAWPESGETYIAETTLLRVEKLIGMRGAEACSLQQDAAMVYLHGAVNKTNNAGREAIMAFAEGDELRVMLMGLKRFTKIEPLNLKDARRRLADAAIEKGGYIF